MKSTIEDPGEGKRLLSFLKNTPERFRIYQPYAIRILLEQGKENNFSIDESKIVSKIKSLTLHRQTNRKELRDYLESLTDVKKYTWHSNLLIFDDDHDPPIWKLNPDEFHVSQTDEILKQCNNEIGKFHVCAFIDSKKPKPEVYFIFAGDGSGGMWYDEFVKNIHDPTSSLDWETAGVDYREHANFDLTTKSDTEIRKLPNGIELTTIKNIKKGSIVGIHKNNSDGIINIGIVTKEYHFENNATSYIHRIGVKYLNITIPQITYEYKKGIYHTPQYQYEILKHLLGDKKDILEKGMTDTNDLIHDEQQSDTLNQDNYDRALKLKPNLILYGPPGTGKTFIAKKIAERKAKNSKIWLWAVTPENWKVVVEKKVWGNNDEINKLREHILKNDIVVFYVTTTHEIQGIFKFSGDWYQAKEDIWNGDESVGNDIIIDEICLGHVDIRNLHDKLDLFKGATSLNAINARLQSKGKIRRGPSAELTRKDFNIISEIMGVTVETQFTRMVTFHPSYSYEDFVEGFRPKVDGSGSYLLQNGIFKQICIDAEKDPDKTYVIIIDEINRGNIPKIFGELITLIEKDKRYQKDSLMLTYSQNPFFVPENLIIIGTMNTADKSLMQMDDALKRRFVFEELMPDTKLLLDHLKENNVTNAEYYSNILNRINEKILGTGTEKEFTKTKQFRDRQIGHSYFWDICKDGKSDPDDDLQNIIKYDIIPLLQDYFYGDYSEIQKIFSKKNSDVDHKDDKIIGDDNRPTELVTKKSKSKLLRETLSEI